VQEANKHTFEHADNTKKYIILEDMFIHAVIVQHDLFPEGQRPGHHLEIGSLTDCLHKTA
jgi:hypothetical protein